MPPPSADLEAQRSLLINFDKNWASLQGAIRSMSSIEPYLIDCNQDEETIEKDVVIHLEGTLKFACVSMHIDFPEVASPDHFS